MDMFKLDTRIEVTPAGLVALARRNPRLIRCTPTTAGRRAVQTFLEARNVIVEPHRLAPTDTETPTN